MGIAGNMFGEGRDSPLQIAKQLKAPITKRTGKIPPPKLLIYLKEINNPAIIIYILVSN